MMKKTIENITINNLCIGCGLCRLSCPNNAITLRWAAQKVWQAVIDQNKCNNCSHCFHACPQQPPNLADLMVEAKRIGVNYGLHNAQLLALGNAKSHNDSPSSASGGLVTFLINELLQNHLVDAVITVFPVSKQLGESHFETRLIDQTEQLSEARGSHYQFVSYDLALQEAKRLNKTVAVVATPCVLRGIDLLPKTYSDLMLFKISLACSHNATGGFADCLASEAGITAGNNYLIRFRDNVNITMTSEYNNTFETDSFFKRVCRFDNSFTKLWRRYFYSHDACLYCPDFFGVNADISFKDAWGVKSECTIGNSIVIVRNPSLVSLFRKTAEQKTIKLVELSQKEFQPFVQKTQKFKHCQSMSRSISNKEIWSNLPKDKRRFHLPSIIVGCFYLLNIRLSQSLSFKHVIRIVRFVDRFSIVPRKFISLFKRIKKLFELLFQLAVDRFQLYDSSKFTDEIDVLICGGYGYGNVGDEVQLAANLQRWRDLEPEKKIKVLTPNIDFTKKMHGNVDVALAPRRSFFGYRGRDYVGSWAAFRLVFILVAPLLLLNTWLLKKGLPLVGLSKDQSETLCRLHHTEVLFLSGGGYLTGMTRTRLWDHMLLLRLAKMLGTTTVLSGQTIGVLDHLLDRFIAKWGLSCADVLFVRDNEGSPEAIRAIGLDFDSQKATFDDALFYLGLDKEALMPVLKEINIKLPDEYIAVNVHFWKQSAKDSSTIVQMFAKSLDQLIEKHNLPIVFVAMHPTDAYASNEVRLNMKNDSLLVNMCDSVEVTVGVLQNAHICITMKHHPIIFSYTCGVPVISIVLDDYYYHKNMGAHMLFQQEGYVIVMSRDIGVDIIERAKKIIADRANLSKNILHKAKELKLLEGAAIAEYSTFSLGRNNR